MKITWRRLLLLGGELLVDLLQGDHGGGAYVGAVHVAEEDEDQLVPEVGQAHRALRALEGEVHGLGVQEAGAEKAVATLGHEEVA
jgi:hypothetical protein